MVESSINDKLAAQKKLITLCIETTRYLSRLSEQVPKLVKIAQKTGCDKGKRTAKGRMPQYRMFRDLMAFIRPNMFKLISLWDITAPELAVSSQVTAGRFSDRKFRKHLVQLTTKLQLADAMGVVCQLAEDEQLPMLRAGVVASMKRFVHSVGTNMFIIQCFYKYRVELGYAEN